MLFKEIANPINDQELTSVLRLIKDLEKTSMSHIQRNLPCGFNKASALFNYLIANDYVDDKNNVNKKEVYSALGEDYNPGLKLIFLDVDGVLNCSSTRDVLNGYVGIEDRKVELLKQIVDATKAKIVLISSWKEFWFKDPHQKQEQDVSADYLDLKLKNKGLTIIDKTSDFFLGRGEGIRAYIEQLKWMGIPVDKFVILDDGQFDYKKTKLTKNLIQTGFLSGGLKEKHVKRAIEKLC